MLRLLALSCCLAAASAQSRQPFDFIGLINGIGNLIGGLSSNTSVADDIQSFCESQVSGSSSGTGSILDSCRRRPLNLLLVVDTANAAEYKQKELDAVKGALKNIVRGFEIAPSATRVALVQFAAVANTAFSFNTHRSVSDVTQAIDELRPQLGVSNPLAALNKAKTELTSRKGWRKEVPTIILTLTHRSTPVNLKPTMDRITAMARNIRPIVIGVQVAKPRPFVGAKLRRQQLVDLAGGSKDNIVLVCGFERVNAELATAMTQQICSSVDRTCRRSPSDLLFVVETPGQDNSENMRNLKGFLTSMLDVMEIGEDATKVGIYQYGTAGSDATLRLSGRRGEIEGAIERMKALSYDESKKSQLYQTLQRIWTEIQPASNRVGLRKGRADPVIVVIARGPSQIVPTGFSNLLRNNAGATLISLGVGRRVSAKDLEYIDGSDRRRMRVPGYSGLDRRRRNFLASIVCAEKPAIRLTGGVLQHQACLKAQAGLEPFKSMVPAQMRKASQAMSHADASPKECLRLCPEGTEAVGIRLKTECYCGRRRLSPTQISKATAATGWCAIDCLNWPHNPNNVKCGSGIGMSLYHLRGADLD